MRDTKAKSNGIKGQQTLAHWFTKPSPATKVCQHRCAIHSSSTASQQQTLDENVSPPATNTPATRTTPNKPGACMQFHLNH